MIENCRHCGKEIQGEGTFCPECRSLAGEKKMGRLWVFSILFSITMLSLTGLMVWHGGFGNWSFSLGSFRGKPIAVINGESISGDDFKSRMKSVQASIEREHGKNTFTGERGQALLGALEQEVLDGMLEEKLVAQEARKLKVEIRKDQVEEEVQRVSKEIYGDWQKFQARLREDGVSPDELKRHINNFLLYSALREAKTPAGADPEVSFNAWLIQAKQKAELLINETGNRASAVSFSRGSCCAPERPTAPSRPGGQINPQIESDAKRAALEAYQKANPADKEVAAKVTDYGCHMQVDIQKEGKIVKSYSYQGGRVFEIS